MQSLIRVIYTSTAADGLDREAMKRLLSTARASNAAFRVTGVLVHAGSQFLQALEGNADTVDELFARITRDPRHSGVLTLVREPVEQRMFDAWHLGFSTLSPLQIATLCGANESGISVLGIAELNVGRAKRLLNALAGSARRAHQAPAAAAA